MWNLIKLFKKYYYNNKYPKTNAVYRRTDRFITRNIDVRQFLNHNNFQLPKFTGTDDEIARKSLLWVIGNITYIPDKTQYKNNEYWAFGYETLASKRGDCEDGAILLYEILRKNGLPAWKIRLSVGYVKVNGKNVGHAYVTYYCEEANKWVALDWCYWPSTLNINLRPSYNDMPKYLGVWFSFNELYSWGKVKWN